MKQCLPLKLLLITIFLSSLAHGEIYKWTDENGKVHYGDRPPSTAQANDISSQLNTPNISSDFSSPSMMLDAKKGEENKRERTRREANQKRENDKAREDFCREAQTRLWQLQGPVVFFDDKGKEVKVTEKERQQRERKLQQEMNEKCK